MVVVDLFIKNYANILLFTMPNNFWKIVIFDRSYTSVYDL